jgi:hypothetical protein
VRAESGQDAFGKYIEKGNANKLYKKMDGNLNINRIIKLFIIAIFFTSCENDCNVEQKFIENNFLTIVDTLAYQHGSFRPPLSNKAIKATPYSNLCIRLVDTIGHNNSVQKYIDSFFAENKDLRIAFQDVLNSTNYSEFIIDSNFPRKIGKYHISLNEKYIDKSNKYVGKIEIQNFKISKDKIILIVSKSVGYSKIVFIELFRKEKGDWKLIKKEFFIRILKG